MSYSFLVFCLFAFLLIVKSVFLNWFADNKTILNLKDTVKV